MRWGLSTDLSVGLPRKMVSLPPVWSQALGEVIEERVYRRLSPKSLSHTLTVFLLFLFFSVGSRNPVIHGSRGVTTFARHGGCTLGFLSTSSSLKDAPRCSEALHFCQQQHSNTVLTHSAFCSLATSDSLSRRLDQQRTLVLYPKSLKRIPETVILHLQAKVFQAQKAPPCSCQKGHCPWTKSLL